MSQASHFTGTRPFAIGSDTWPGLAKLAEECGELVQVIGKVMAYPEGAHPDGNGHLARRLVDELGDVKAAIDYVAAHNAATPRREVDIRRDAKFERFQRWDHAEAQGLCGRLLIGQGSDVFDPTCVLEKGHSGRCCPPSIKTRAQVLR